jgi:hypothetical protein
MNMLIALGVAALALCVLWATQSAVLALVGEPLAWPLRYTTRNPLVRWTGRVMVQVAWLIILVGTPLALRLDPLAVLDHAFPAPVPWRDIAVAFSIMFFPYAIVYALLVVTGQVRIEPGYDRATRRAKLFRRFLTPLPLATVEEAVFRGILLELLLAALPSSRASTALAIALSAAAFSAVHFVKRPDPRRPVWLPAYGLFIVGSLFGVAYVVGGRSLWLPIPMHAAAIFITEVMRLYALPRGPPWLVGTPECPQSGLVGSLLVVGMGIALVVLI